MSVVRSACHISDISRIILRRALASVLVCAALLFAFAPAFADLADAADAPDTRPFIGDRYGVTREKLVSWLSSHEHDNYYLGTKYDKLAYTAPNGDPNAAVNPIYSTGGVPMMNCAGFVAHVVYKCGLDTVKWNDYLRTNHPALYNRQSYNIASADMWYLHATGDDTGFQGAKELTGAFRYYSFPSIYDALSSGKMRKGDMFIFWPKEGYAKDRTTQDSHIGIYWSDVPGENKFWHMHYPYNEIGPIYNFPGPYDFIVIPLSEDTDGGTLTVTERNEEKALLSGAKFTVTDTKSGFKYTLGPTGPDGSASLYLPVGTYSVKHSAFPSGYVSAVTMAWTATVSRGKTTRLDTVCAKPGGTLEITQTDGAGKGLSGAAFTAVRKSDRATVEIKATNSSGKTSAKLAPGTYTVTQTAFPAHYRAKGSATWTVTVETGRDVSLATYAELEKGGVGVSVVDSEGEGVAGVYFAVRDVADLAAEPVAEIMTDVNGTVVYGLESGEYTIDHGTVLYLHFERSAWDSYVADTRTYRVSVRGGETVWLGGGEIALAEKSTVTLAADIPEGEYAIYTDAACEKRAKVPTDDNSALTDALIATGKSAVLAPGTYYLRLNEDISRLHDGTTVTYTVEAKALRTVEVKSDSAVTAQFVHHAADPDGETGENERGFVTHRCAGCGEQILFGDVNGDGALNARDVTAMMRRLAGISVEVDASVADMNGDYKFNAKDVIALMRLVASM